MSTETEAPQKVDAFDLRDTGPPPEQQTLALDARPVAIIFPSRSGGPGHVVGIVDDPRSLHLTCTCRAYLGVLATSHEGCWAMKEVRRLLQAPEGEIHASDSAAP